MKRNQCRERIAAFLILMENYPEIPKSEKKGEYKKHGQRDVMQKGVNIVI